MPRRASDSISELAAARWAARSFGGMTSDERGEFERWLAVDRRHEGAYLRARAAAFAMEDAVVEAAGHSPDLSMTTAPRAARSWKKAGFFAGVTALAASVALVIGLDDRPGTLPDAPVMSGRIVNLDDGSIVTLGSEGRIRTALSAQARDIVLAEGEASFRVVKDKSRPFIVHSGDIHAEATGTEYSVQRLGTAGARVSVKEGTVLVWTGEDRAGGIELGKGQSRAFSPGTAVTRHASPASGEPIELTDTPIGLAVTRFNAANMIQISVEDPIVSATKIDGVFKRDDPEAFARAAAVISGAHMQRKGNRIIIRK